MPLSIVEVVAEKVVEVTHVQLLGEEQVVGNVLQYFATQREASLHSTAWLLLHYTKLIRRHCKYTTFTYNAY
jgi:hypothetical protein